MLYRFSSIGGALTIAAGLFVALPAVPAPPVVAHSEISLAATALIMGGANGGGTIGDGTMLAVLDGRYADDTRICVSWPAEIAPLYGTTTLGESIAIGADNLEAAIRAQYELHPDTPIVAVGLSQASEVLDATMARLQNDPTAPPPEKLSFVVLGDSDRGVLAWFKGITLPVFDYTPQPIPVTSYNVTVVKGEYDGFADPPDRWWNLIAMYNAAAGTGFFPGFGSVHYAALWTNLDDVPPENITVTRNAAGGYTTTYLVPTNDLPMLRPLVDQGVPQDTIDALESVLRPIIDSAYVRNDRPQARPQAPTRPARAAAANRFTAATAAPAPTARPAATTRPTAAKASGTPGGKRSEPTRHKSTRKGVSDG